MLHLVCHEPIYHGFMTCQRVSRGSLNAVMASRLFLAVLSTTIVHQFGPVGLTLPSNFNLPTAPAILVLSSIRIDASSRCMDRWCWVSTRTATRYDCVCFPLSFIVFLALRSFLPSPLSLLRILRTHWLITSPYTCLLYVQTFNQFLAFLTFFLLFI